MADEEMIEQEVDIDVITGFDVIPAVMGGYDCVVLIVGKDDPESGDTTNVLYAVSAEDALEMAGAMKSIAATVRPFTVQQRIKQAEEAGEDHANG